jgi:hypothetical protein
VISDSENQNGGSAFVLPRAAEHTNRLKILGDIVLRLSIGTPFRQFGVGSPQARASRKTFSKLPDRIYPNHQNNCFVRQYRYNLTGFQLTRFHKRDDR